MSPVGIALIVGFIVILIVCVMIDKKGNEKFKNQIRTALEPSHVVMPTFECGYFDFSKGKIPRLIIYGRSPPNCSYVTMVVMGMARSDRMSGYFRHTKSDITVRICHDTASTALGKHKTRVPQIAYFHFSSEML